MGCLEALTSLAALIAAVTRCMPISTSIAARSLVQNCVQLAIRGSSSCVYARDVLNLRQWLLDRGLTMLCPLRAPSGLGNTCRQRRIGGKA